MEVAKLAISHCFLLTAITASHQEEVFDEPRCSKFHFEEKLLEKVVRFEVKLETMQTKFDELANELMIQQQIVTQDRDQMLIDARALKADLTNDAQALKADLTSDAQALKADLTSDAQALTANLTSDAQDLRASLETSKAAADGRVDELVKTTQSQVARMSGDVHTLLNKTTADIIDAANVPPVAFKAKTLKDTRPSVGDVLVFEQVVMNLGGGYDADTGQFTAPQSGVYLFTVQLCLRPKSYKYIHIITGTGEMLNAVLISGSSVHYGCETSTAIASLIQREFVMAQYQHSSSGSLYESANYAESIFSGVLIHNHN